MCRPTIGVLYTKAHTTDCGQNISSVITIYLKARKIFSGLYLKNCEASEVHTWWLDWGHWLGKV